MQNGAKRWLLLAMAAAFGVSCLSSYFNRYYLGIAIDVGINIILAVSLNLINGHTGQFSLGHAGFMAVGGYTAAKFTLVFSPQIAQSIPAPLQPFFFLFALILGGLMAALVGLAVGVPSLRLRGDYLAIVTLGFGEIIRVVFQNMESVGAASGLKNIAGYTNLLWAFAGAAVTVYVVGCLVHSTYGRGFIAVHDDEVAASAMGVNPTRYKVTAFVVGAFFAGIAGGLYAHHKQFLSPTGFDFMKSIDIVVMVILGGMGRTGGVIIAAVLLTLMPEWLRMLPTFTVNIPWSGPTTVQLVDFRMVIYSLLIIGLMMARPQGLFSFRRPLENRPQLTGRMSASGNSTLLQIENCTIRFGGLTAVSALSFQIGPNDLVGLIGPNGAGKTTVFNLITGVYQPTEGNILFNGKSILRHKPHQLAKLGLARTFQNIRLFGSLSVFDNVRAALQLHRPHGIRDALWRDRGFREGEKAVTDQVMEMLELFRLTRFRDEIATNLPYGDQRRLEIVRALATQPKLLLLDEPAAGMNPTEKVELMKLIQFVKDKYQIAVLLVEHDMQVVMGMCQRIAVLDYGIKIAEGTPGEVRKNPKVIEAYLGEEPAIKN